MTEENINKESQLTNLYEEKKSKRKYIIIGNVLIFFFCIFAAGFSFPNIFGPQTGANTMRAYAFLFFLATLAIQIVSLIIAIIINFFRKDTYNAKTYLMSLLSIVLIIATFILYMLLSIRLEINN